MKSARNILMTLLPVLAMTVLILDAKTALAGAQSGVELCIRVVIPSLFPFLFLSVIFTGILMGRSIRLLRPLSRICRIPAGSESLLAVGLLGGYPVGAQSIAQAYRSGHLSKEDAHRMLGFCSNAGPSFIFGMLSAVFEPVALWALWGIHMLSALLTGILLPGGSRKQIRVRPSPAVPASLALERSLKVMASICGWVIVFRVLLSFCQRWFLWMLPAEAGIVVSGLLELTNGCCRLELADGAGVRFLTASVLLGCGGICIGLQTISVTQGMGTGAYFPGKLLQGSISLVLAWAAQFLLFPAEDCCFLHPVIPALTISAALLSFSVKIPKKHSSNLARQGV